MRSPYPSSIDQESTHDQMWDNRRMVRGKIAFLFIRRYNNMHLPCLREEVESQIYTLFNVYFRISHKRRQNAHAVRTITQREGGVQFNPPPPPVKPCYLSMINIHNIKIETLKPKGYHSVSNKN